MNTQNEALDKKPGPDILKHILILTALGLGGLAVFWRKVR
jgi:hypothetical protein